MWNKYFSNVSHYRHIKLLGFCILKYTALFFTYLTVGVADVAQI
jgi:hypothetical protein